jgi:hypothetical protein
MKFSLVAVSLITLLSIAPTHADSASVQAKAQTFSSSLAALFEMSCEEDCSEKIHAFQTATQKNISELEQEIAVSWLEGVSEREAFLKTPEFLALNGLNQNLIRTKYLIAEHEKGMARFDLMNISDSVKALEDLGQMDKIVVRIKRVLNQSQKLGFSLEEILRKL